MAEYIYLFRGGDAGGSPQEMQAHMGKWMAWMKELTTTGHFKAGEPLEEGGKVISGTKKVVIDGPYAEAKDLVGGYLVVTAKNLDEASDLAKGCPIFERNGIVEVRPVKVMPR